MGLVLEKGAHFQYVCFYDIFQKSNVSVVISAPLGVRGPLRAPPWRPTGSSWGLPWPLLRPQRKTQPTVVISVRTASLFRKNGLCAREGCTFLETLFFSVLSTSPPRPLGLLRPFLKTNAKKGPPSSTLDPKGAPKGTPKNQIRQKRTPKRDQDEY